MLQGRGQDGQGTNKTAICLLCTSPSGNVAEIWRVGRPQGDIVDGRLHESVNTSCNVFARIWKLLELLRGHLLDIAKNMHQ